MYIYKTTNLINGKIYIGKSTKEINESTDYFGSGTLVNKAIEKYGVENFKKEIICEADELEELNGLEKYWIKELKSQDRDIGYNITDGGDGFTGCFHRETSKLKTSESLKGRVRSKKERYSISIGQQNMSINAKREKSEKLSKKLTGKSKSPEHVEKNRQSFKLSGESHPHTKIIGIFDEEGVLVYISKGSFGKFCKEHSLPYSSFKRSYQQGGKKILASNKINKKYLNSPFRYWYAKELG